MRPVSKLSLSKLADVSPAAVTKAIREGRLVTLPDGSIDADSPECAAYISSKSNIKQRKRSKKVQKPPESQQNQQVQTPRAPPVPPVDLGYDDGEISAAMDKLTLERRKLAAQAQQLELKNAQIEGRLVAREVMIRGVWNPLETFLVRLLTDGAKTITSTAFALIRSGLEAEARGEKGVPREDVEVAVRNELSSLIKPLKRDIKRALLDDV